MIFQLKNNQIIFFRLLEQKDAGSLYQYLNNLSAESQSRFGPHLFDKLTIETICNNLPGDAYRFIAEDVSQNIIAYMIVKKGMIEADKSRYKLLNIFFDEVKTGTYAPSVADSWQNVGVGNAMFHYVMEDIKNIGFKYLVLWGGVQKTNQRAIHFYRKHSFKQTGTFWHDGKDNLDMYLEL